MGLFEAEAAAWNVGGIPEDFSFGEIPPDWGRMSPYLEKAMSRVPATLAVGAKKFFCGPESFCPDLAPLVGPTNEIPNYWVAAGLNSIGILTGGGIGRLVANWLLTGAPDMDVTGMNVNRAHPYQSNPAYRAARVVESLGLVYKCHYPYRSPTTARNNKRSPIHAHLAAAGASFKDVSGWEGADFFDGGVGDALQWGRAKWFPQWAKEHSAVRTSAGLIDMSFMSKFRVQGPGAGSLLNWMSTANVDGASGEIVYTQWCNARGTLEADLTVTKHGEGDFMVVATDTAHRHVEGLLRRAAKEWAPRGTVVVTDVSGALAQLNVQGPRARDLLQRCTSVDLSNVAFPFRAAREIDIGFARVLCTRITYVGREGVLLLVTVSGCVLGGAC